MPCLYRILNQSILRGDDQFAQNEFPGGLMFCIPKPVAQCIFILNVCANRQANRGAVMTVGLKRHDRHTIRRGAETAIEVCKCVPQFQ